jgi:transposase
MVTPRPLEGWSSEKRTYRQFSPEQKAEVVLAGLRGDRERAGRLWRAPERRDAVRPVARSAAGRRQAALANPRGKTPEQAELDRLTARWASSSGPWAGGPTSRRSRGNPLRAGVSVHVAQSRVVVAAGSQPALVARVAGVCRQAPCTGAGAAGLGRLDGGAPAGTTRSSSTWPGPSATDGTRMVAALAGRELGRAGQLQARAAGDADPSVAAAVTIDQPRPGFPRDPPRRAVASGRDQAVDRPSTAGFYLQAIIDCSPREVTG